MIAIVGVCFVVVGGGVRGTGVCYGGGAVGVGSFVAVIGSVGICDDDDSVVYGGGGGAVIGYFFGVGNVDVGDG
jgi:hypothetical protein